MQILTQLEQALEIRMTEGRGRGVFASKDFAPGELIERAPVLVVPARDWPQVEKSLFFDYLFAWGEEPDCTALVLGYGSIYNHSYSPCARYIKRLEENLLDFIALRPIKMSEEITINYNGDPLCKDPLWFQVTE